MKNQIIGMVAKAAPLVKKYGFGVIAGFSGAIEFISDQKKAEQLKDLTKRVAELEKLVNK